MTLRFNILRVFIFLFWSTTVNAQNKDIDSLKRVLQDQRDDTNKVNTLHALISAFAKAGDYESILQFANEELSLAQRLGYQKGEARSNYMIGLALSSKHQTNLPEAIQHLSKALEIY